MKKYIVGNWKMNQKKSDIEAFFKDFSFNTSNVEAWIAPQSFHIPALLKEEKVQVGGQNCCTNNSGAFTGENSPEGLKDIGASFVLIAHSERRSIYKESHDEINEKIKTALEAGLKVIYCVGETLEHREKGMTESVVKNQIDNELVGLPEALLTNIIVAYEPVWAIGTGKTASPEQAEEVHSFLRSYLNESSSLNGDLTPLLYGGSVKPENAKELLSMENIDGALVGGASLKSESFLKLCEIANAL